MSPRAAKAAPAATVPDPLADLREAEAPAGPPAPEAASAPPAAPIVAQALEVHPDATTALVAAWHRDRVTAGSLHGGGVCICAHMARLAIAVLPAHIAVVPATDPEGPDDGDE